MKTILITLTALFAIPALANDSVYNDLSGRAGIYVLTSNNPANPCRAVGDFAIGSETRLNIYQAPKTTEFETAGDTVVKVEQYFSTLLKKWGTRFDRAPFSHFNKGTRHFDLPEVKIAHTSVLDTEMGILMHTVTMSDHSGSADAIQKIQFTANGFIYAYVLVDRGADGKVLKVTPAGTCTFTRK